MTDIISTEKKPQAFRREVFLSAVRLQKTVIAGVADSLIISIGAAKRSFIFHTAFFHYFSRVWIPGIMP